MVKEKGTEDRSIKGKRHLCVTNNQKTPINFNPNNTNISSNSHDHNK
jgi:hypothetical protein